MTEPTTPQALLERAAVLLDERGWFQGEYIGPDGCLCALGAIRAAAAEIADVPLRSVYDFTDSLFRQELPPELRDSWLQAEDALLDVLPYRDVPLWNDEDGRTKGEVQALLRRAANSEATS